MDRLVAYLLMLLLVIHPRFVDFFFCTSSIEELASWSIVLACLWTAIECIVRSEPAGSILTFVFYRWAVWSRKNHGHLWRNDLLLREDTVSELDFPKAIPENFSASMNFVSQSNASSTTSVLFDWLQSTNTQWCLRQSDTIMSLTVELKPMKLIYY